MVEKGGERSTPIQRCLRKWLEVNIKRINSSCHWVRHFDVCPFSLLIYIFNNKKTDFQVSYNQHALLLLWQRLGGNANPAALCGHLWWALQHPSQPRHRLTRSRAAGHQAQLSSSVHPVLLGQSASCMAGSGALHVLPKRPPRPGSCPPATTSQCRCFHGPKRVSTGTYD